jgi:hypothetical protein
MKKITMFPLVALCAGLGYGQSITPKKVAVYVTGGQNAGINKVLGDQLVAAFVNSGKYIAIERTASFLAELHKEQNYQQTGNVDDNEISRLGKQFGVHLVCVADVSDVFGQKYVSARLVDVESAEVINTANISSPLSKMEELMEVTKNITATLTGKTAKEKAAEAAKETAAREKGYLIVGNLAVQINTSAGTDWASANRMAQQSRLAGYSNWRLPTMAELTQIKAILKSLNIGVQYPIFWSNEECTTSERVNDGKNIVTKIKQGHYTLYFDKFECRANDHKYSNENTSAVLVRTIE